MSLFNFTRSFLLLVGFLYFLPNPLVGAPLDGTLHLTNGKSLSGTIVSVNADSLQWKGDGASSAIRMPFSNFTWLEMNGDDAWIEAEKNFAEGNFQEVIEFYKEVAERKSSLNGYPAVGNHATLAQRRLLDCYRGLLDPYYVGFYFRELEQDKLAPRDRITPIMEAWALAGQKVRDPAIKKIDEVLTKVSPTTPEAIELHWLKGRTLAAHKEPSAALRSLCKAYTINAGANHRLAPLALKQSVNVLAEQPGRQLETQAMLRLYTNVYGKGKLWKDAPEEYTTLLDQKLDGGSGINFFGSGGSVMDDKPTPSEESPTAEEE